MTYSCLISKMQIKEGERIYVLPLVFKELLVLEKTERYKNSISRFINLKNELYRVALLPVEAVFKNNRITLIDNAVSGFFEKKTGISFQAILDSFVKEDDSLHYKYFEKTKSNDRVSKQLFPCFIRKKVWDECIKKISVSDSLWNNIYVCDISVFASLGFKKNSCIEYSHNEIDDLVIYENCGSFELKKNIWTRTVHSVKEIESFLNESNLTIGEAFIQFSKDAKTTQWEIARFINKSYLSHGYFEDLSPLFSEFYDKDIENFMVELTDLIEMLNILFAANIMLDKPKYVPNLSNSDKTVKALHKLLIDTDTE